ncbi:ribonuclease H-like domain-containing protein, partial [Tanacetum coccineum]
YIRAMPPRTAKRIVARKEREKQFHKMTDAKEMWDATKSRFGGNDESKKMQKYILKQQFKGFSVSNTEGFHKGYDRFQSLLSQLEIHEAGVSTEDANQKFLRSLPSVWSQVSLIMRTKPGMDSLSFDDLYNNLRVFESDVKGPTAASSSSQNVAFYEHTSSYSLLTNQSSCPQLDHEDLEQLDEYDLEEMNLKWQMAMISMRMKKFYKKTGRKLQFDAKEPVGFDKTKVECYNCHKTEHFAKECRIKRTQDYKRRDVWNSGNKDGSRNGKKEESKALVKVDGEDIEVTSCSTKCKDSYANLKKLYDAQREQLSDASVEIKAYSQGLKKVEAQLVAYQQGQLWYEQKIKFMKIDLDDKTDVLTYQKKLLAEAQKEKDDLKAKVEKWHHSSKNLGKLLNSHMSAYDKFGLGYGDHRYNGILSYENEVLQSVFKGKESDFENPPLNDRLVKTGEMHVVPPPMTGNYMPSGPDIEVDYSQFTYDPKQTQPSESESQSNSEDEYVSIPTKEHETPSFANQQVKTPRENVKNQSTHSQKPKVNKKELGYGFTVRACFVCDLTVWKTQNVESYQDGNGLGTLQHSESSKQLNLGKLVLLGEKGKLLLSPQQVVIGDYKDTAGTMSPNTMVDPILETDYPHRALKNKRIVDSGCFRHMTGNKAYLAEFQDFNGGPVAFGGSKSYITGFLVGYSLQSKAFRVYNLETKRVEENPHITFLENKPNVARKGPTWLFDLDYLTDSMNYHPVRSKNQANHHAGQQEANQNAGTEDILNGRDSEKEDESAQDCYVLPIWPSYSSTITPALKSADKKEGPREEEQVFMDELERLKRQEKEANEEAEALRKNFENLVIQAGAAKPSSTNIFSTVSTPANVSSTNLVNAVSIPVSTASPNNGLSLSAPTNPEDIYQNSTDGIFTTSSYDDEGAVVDYTNLEIVVNVSPIPTLRIHLSHLSALILGDPTSAVQTRSKVNKSSGAHDFVSYVQKQKRNNHKDFQHCLFACFLSQNEPKKISEAL